MKPLVTLGLTVLGAAALGGAVCGIMRLDDQTGGPLKRALREAREAQITQDHLREIDALEKACSFVRSHGPDDPSARDLGVNLEILQTRQEDAALAHVQQAIARAERLEGVDRKNALTAALDRLATMQSRFPQYARLTEFDRSPLAGQLAGTERALQDSLSAHLEAAAAAARRANQEEAGSWRHVETCRKELQAATRDLAALDGASHERRDLGGRMSELEQQLRADPSFKNFRQNESTYTKVKDLKRRLEIARQQFEDKKSRLDRGRKNLREQYDAFRGENPTAVLKQSSKEGAPAEPLTARVEELSRDLFAAHQAAVLYAGTADDLAELDGTAAGERDRARAAVGPLAGDDYRSEFDRFAGALSDWRAGQLGPDRGRRSGDNPSDQLRKAYEIFRNWDKDFGPSPVRPVNPAARPTPVPTPRPVARAGTAGGAEGIESNDLIRAQ